MPKQMRMCPKCQYLDPTNGLYQCPRCRAYFVTITVHDTLKPNRHVARPDPRRTPGKL